MALLSYLLLMLLVSECNLCALVKSLSVQSGLTSVAGVPELKVTTLVNS